MSRSRPQNAYDDEELSISLTPSQSRRAQNNPPPPRPDRGPAPGPDHRLADGPKQQKAEQRIGAYQIIRTLGEGSFGKVKLAVHRTTGQEVALKIIARRKLISRDMAGRVEREIEYLQLLRHPHIIKLYTVIKTQTEIIMVLEYAGGELFDYIVQNGKMREDAARRFFQQIICAVEYCHRHKIVHRDLKPENLLLDNGLNVKIADFGLSNIMTDGNFLKTSCGSPNYAAPEVINGKLYAGPEVDVWSCGVILYVLLVGRLPFDDEHIPSLFAKIARGHYVVPSYISKSAADIIAKMLAVNPVHRATIDEIRQHEWFMKDLPAYLQPPVEEFLDTGVDPNKAITPKAIAPGASVAIQEKLHGEVVGKISKTMGYGKKDVQEALEAEEPSAIKDAYLIVRENKLMQANPNLSDAKGVNPYDLPSPPPWNSVMENAKMEGAKATKPEPSGLKSLKEMKEGMNAPEPNDNDIPYCPLTEEEKAALKSQEGLDQPAASEQPASRPYTSNIRILPSSLTPFHRAYMAQLKAGKDPVAAAEEAEGAAVPRSQSEREKAENARRLKGISKSPVMLEEGSSKPAGMTPVPQKKARPTKWQFGIRSRNSPLEAIGCIYRALQKLGAQWLIDGTWNGKAEDSTEPVDGESSFSSQQDGGSLHRATSRDSDGSGNSGRYEDRNSNGEYNLPADPWVLRVRWKLDNLYPPGVIPPSSTHSSAVDLRRPSIASLSSSGTGSAPHESSMKGAEGRERGESIKATGCVVMHLDIQLYEMEQGVYLVDFKCAGYENRDGKLLEEKDVTSPFPFLDLASKLIIQLAEAD